MCTPWTITRIARWRIRDWALSFFACGFSLDDEPDTFCSSSNGVSAGTRVCNTKDDRHETNKRVAQGNRSKRERKVGQGSGQAKNTRIAEKRFDESSWPRFADEDYIVFCFREDGAFDVVKDVKSKASSDHLDREVESSRPVNRKLVYAEDAESVHSNKHEYKSNADGHGNDDYPTHERKPIISDKEAEEEKTIYIDSDSPSDQMKRGDKIEVEEGGAAVSVESSGSNQSEGSTGSFAFPVLRWEWVGSPIQMPKSEGLRLRKQKARCIGLYCCRF